MRNDLIGINPISIYTELGAAPSGGGGGDSYTASAITISGDANVRRGPLIGVVDGPTGFISLWAKPDPASVGIDFARTVLGNFEARFELQPPNSQFQSFFWDEEGNSFTELGGPENDAVDWSTWHHVLLAWDVGHAKGSRRWALYIDDASVAISPPNDFDDSGPAFNINYVDDWWVLMPHATGLAPVSYADYGIWLNTSLIEADSTITEANRRKFISATGKPVDPSNWPANPVVKFSGDASTFLTNQGSGGAFSLLSGTVLDAADSPSD